MVVDENTDAGALPVGMSRGRTSNVAETGDDTEDLADLIRAAVWSPTASEVVLDAGPHPPDTGRSRGPGGGRPGPGERRAAAGRGGTRTDRSRGPGQRGRPGRTAAGVGRPDAGGCRPIGGRSTRPNRRRGAATQETAQLSIDNELQSVRAQDKTLPEQSRAHTKQRKAKHRRRALIPESARPMPAGPHTDEAQQRIVETWEISPEAAPVLDRYQQLEAARSPTRPRSDRTG